MMLRRSIAVIAVASMTTMPPSAAVSSSRPPIGFEQINGRFLAPATPFFDEQGTIISIAAFRGKIVILNLWATWCAPCVKEIPSLQRLSSHLPRDRFAVVAVSQDKGGTVIAKGFLERIGVPGLPVYADPQGRLFRDFGIRGLPTTLIIRRDGTVLGKLEGSAEWDADHIVDYLISLPE